jgi:hypothetical protein
MKYAWLWIILSAAACKQQPTPERASEPAPSAQQQNSPSPPTTEQSPKDRCEGSGGTWADSNACECGEAKSMQNGLCVAAEEEARNAKLGCTNGGGNWDSEKSKCSCDDNLSWDGKSCTEESVKPDLRGYSAEVAESLCEDAGGKWRASDEYCDCPGKEVIFIGSCKLMKGRNSDDHCERAKFPGEFSRGVCECKKDGEVFTPARGGCAPRVEVIGRLKDLCEDSLNAGVWNTTDERCKCSGGKVWFEQNCVIQDDLSSREVCESDYHKGKWDSVKRRCICPVSNLWVDQTCVAIRDVPDRTACESELNGGTWNLQLGSCNCPTGKGWLPKVKLCESGIVSGAAQLCIQSGGRAGSTGKCNCPSGTEVSRLDGQAIEFCKVSSSKVPDWMLILLGLSL